ncbi:MAG: NnrU family protein, partial [Polyangiales bacterium]
AGHLGLSFWGLTNPPPDKGLQTRGFYKITRHPLYWSVFCLLFAHMLVFGSTLAVLYFVLMETYNVVGVIVFENRGLAKHYGAALTEFHKQTSTLPFKALVQGRVKLDPGELPRGAIVWAIAFTIVIAAVHEPLLARVMYTVPTLASLR